ncbi:unnamed protein product [Timema podura]|uniref:Uncharacterized protein n=1 Tax=Timema podura TaxID=61482 RepID=A0ABN7NQH3_TIMPD|nr:unnamed protein product [Timema podura]
MFQWVNDHLCDPQVESYCATYSPEVFVVVYSVVDRNSFKAAEDILLFLWKSDYISSKGVILVGNKADLERKREVPLAVGRKLANSCNCKFIETSSGLAHNVDELLVGILAQACTDLSTFSTAILERRPPAVPMDSRLVVWTICNSGIQLWP